MPPSEKPKGAKRWIKRLIDAAILLITIPAIGWQIYDAGRQFHAGELALSWPWLACSFTTYAIGLYLLGLPWRCVLNDGLDPPVPTAAALNVYVISHIGKYVPGKAMAIIIRCTLLAPLGTPMGWVALASVYETFCTMASGSLITIGCLLSPTMPSDYLEKVSGGQPWLGWLAIIGLAAGFLGAVSPIGFQSLTRLVTLVPVPEAKKYAGRRVSGRTFVLSIALGLVAWSVIGFSYWSAIRAVSSTPFGIGEWPRATGCVALSIVGGFLSMLPGQAFVRELILMEALAPVIGKPAAVAAALIYRLVTLITEAILAGVLYAARRPAPVVEAS